MTGYNRCMARGLASVALVIALTAGCASLLDLDEYATGNVGGASSAGGAGAAAGAAGSGGGATIQASSSTGGAAAAGGAGGMCSDTLDCHGSVLDGEAPCIDVPFGSPCVPPGWDFCACTVGMPPFLFFIPPEGVPTNIVVVADPASGPYNIAIGSYCIDAPEQDCVACGQRIYHWTDFSTAGDYASQGNHSVRLWGLDAGAPCDAGGGGSEVIFASYYVP